MIVVVGGIKGGSGKTTVATNLTVLCSVNGRDALLIDADDQETSTDFTALRNEQLANGAGYTNIKLTGASVRNETQRLAGKYDEIIIDTGGRDTTSQRAALTIADVLLVPFVPRSFDVWTLDKVANLVGEIRVVNPKLKAFAFLNRTDARGHDNDEAAEYLREGGEIEFINVPIGARKAFANAAANGLGVVELKPADPKANEEMLKLYEQVYQPK